MGRDTNTMKRGGVPRLMSDKVIKIKRTPKIIVRWSYWAGDEFELRGTAAISKPSYEGAKEMAVELDLHNEVSKVLQETDTEIEPLLCIGGNINHVFQSWVDAFETVQVVRDVKESELRELRRIVSHDTCQIINRIESAHYEMTEGEKRWQDQKM